MIELTKVSLPLTDDADNEGRFVIELHSENGVKVLARLIGSLPESAVIDLCCLLASQYGYSRWSDGRTGIEHDSLTGRAIIRTYYPGG